MFGSMLSFRFVFAATIVSAAGMAATARCSSASEPRLGFQGELAVLGDAIPGMPEVRGMRVLRVDRGSPAAHMGLEKGDIVVTIDGLGFASRKGYLQALRCAGQQPSIMVINVRTGQLVRRSCRLPHVQSEERVGSRDCFPMAIDLPGDLDGSSAENDR